MPMHRHRRGHGVTTSNLDGVVAAYDTTRRMYISQLRDAVRRQPKTSKRLLGLIAQYQGVRIQDTTSLCSALGLQEDAAQALQELDDEATFGSFAINWVAQITDAMPVHTSPQSLTFEAHRFGVTDMATDPAQAQRFISLCQQYHWEVPLIRFIYWMHATNRGTSR